MKTDIRSNRDLPFIVFAITTAFAVFACSLLSPAEAPMQNPSSGTDAGAACLQGILPGRTTKNEVMSLLGIPLATLQDSGMEIMQYASTVYGQANSVAIQNDVVLIMTVVQPEDDPLKWSEIKAQFGEPGFSAYSNYGQGSRTFAFPDRGRAFVADETIDAVLIQECFVPMSLDDYMNLYGNSLPSEDPFIR